MSTTKPEFVSSKLLEQIDCSKPVPRRYDLGMSEFTDDSGKENTPRACVSMSLKKGSKKKAKPLHTEEKDVPAKKRRKPCEPTDRFNFNEISEINYSKMSEGFVPKNTKNDIWAINNFRYWCVERNKTHPSIFVPSISLTNRPRKLRNLHFGWLDMLVRLEVSLVPSTLHLQFLHF